MSFNSIAYLLFLPMVFLLLAVSGPRLRWLVLLTASLYFYLTWQLLYLLWALLLVTAISYGCGLGLAHDRGETARRVCFWIGVVGNLAVLAALKYLPALQEGTNALLSGFGYQLALPAAPEFAALGVSYFVFQAISYLIDVYLELEEPELHAGYFALYLAFFPKLLQGPIERAGDLLPQLKETAGFDQDNFRAGLLQFGWGAFQKVVVADRLALYVNTVYDNVHAYSGMPLLLATYLYAFQLYYDFAGYTDMALGSARMLNIRLTRNFDAPYLSRSLAEYWRRWHISFSRWLLDYLFKPLQMAFRGQGNLGTAAALLLTFVVSGIWHGASWCFLIWGTLHGVYLASSILYKPLQKRLHRRLGLEKTRLLRYWQTAFTFQLVCFAWIFFRANSLADARYLVAHLFGGLTGGGRLLASRGGNELAITAAALASVWLVAWAREHSALGREFAAAPPLLRVGVYVMLAAGVLLFNMDSSAGFLYFKF